MGISDFRTAFENKHIRSSCEQNKNKRAGRLTSYQLHYKPYPEARFRRKPTALTEVLCNSSPSHGHGAELFMVAHFTAGVVLSVLFLQAHLGCL